MQILVNNAAIHDDAAFPGMSAVQWQRVIDVSLNGFYNVTQPLMLPMIRTRWGRIINISSVASLIGNRGQVNYAAAKGALNAATKALSLEVAKPRHHGECGRARDHRERHERPRRSMRPRSRSSCRCSAREARRRWRVWWAYLASPEAGYITGQVISVNGGMA